MKSVYHILNAAPIIERENIQLEYEQLAQELINSGRLRIDTNYYSNFARYTDKTTGINVILSNDELQPDKIEATKSNIKKLYRNYRKPLDDNKLNFIIEDLNKKVKKLLLVSDELKARLTRIFVQSAHPIVIRWLLLDKVEVFITYSHNIGDVMDISSWKRSGSNSGMQSTDGLNVCIYVSCGGDPFGQNSDSHPMYGDGWAALARMQIIAAQEIGHFADIKRDAMGRQVTRHSSNFSCTKPTPHVSHARKHDIKKCHELMTLLTKAGMDKLINIEKQLKFYDVQKISGLRVSWLKLLAKYYSYKLVNFATNHNLHFVRQFYNREKYTGLMIAAAIEDMLANLSPMADVYKRDDPDAEEAVNCAEALARVPQQVMKWGHLTTKTLMHDLYKVYYNEVIPSLINSYCAFTGKEYKRDFTVIKSSIAKKIFNLLIRRNDNTIKFKEVRNLD
ncbi:MAG: DUF2748 family protein [Rickettsiales bacterium]|nr:DUF2748 family protein [Rickettsiales bacterium]